MKRKLVLLAALGACGVSEEIYNARVSDLNRTKADLDKVSSDREACRTRIAELQAQNDAMRKHLLATGQDVSRLQESLESTRKQFDELRRQHEVAEKRAQTYRDLVAKLKSMIDAGQLQVETREGRMIVKLSDEILFDPGQTAIKPAGQAALTQLAEVLGQIPDRHFQVAGHTDTTPVKGGRFRSNWELSTARALMVVRFLSKNGVEAKRLSAAGYGEFSSIDTNDAPEGRARNRRIEIVVQPNIEDLPQSE